MPPILANDRPQQMCFADTRRPTKQQRRRLLPSAPGQLRRAKRILIARAHNKRRQISNTIRRQCLTLRRFPSRSRLSDRNDVSNSRFVVATSSFRRQFPIAILNRHADLIHDRSIVSSNRFPTCPNIVGQILLDPLEHKAARRADRQTASHNKLLRLRFEPQLEALRTDSPSQFGRQRRRDL